MRLQHRQHLLGKELQAPLGHIVGHAAEAEGDVELEIADEVFLTGSAAEVTPVRSVDKIKVGNGKRGPVTERIQQAFFGLFDGSTADRWGWLEPIMDAAGGRSAAL